MSTLLFLLQSSTVWNMNLIPTIFVLICTYWLLAGRWLQRFVPSSLTPSPQQAVYASIGLLIYLLCWASPLYGLSHVMFSLHMLQMSLFYFIGTPFLILGIPEAVLASAARRLQRLRPAGRFLTLPVTSIVMFNGLFMVYHIPIVMETIMSSRVFHPFFYGLLFAASVCVWWPVVNPVSTHRLRGKKKTQFMWTNTMVLMPGCLLLLLPFIQYDRFEQLQMQMDMLGLCIPPSMQLDELLQIRHFTPAFDQKLGGFIMIVLHKMSFLLVEKTNSLDAYNGTYLHQKKSTFLSH